MRNLILRDCSILEIGVSRLKAKLCIDPLSKSLFQVSINGIISLNHKDEKWKEVSWKENELTPSDIASAEVVSSVNSICVALTDGDLVLVGLEDGEVETVGSVSDGIYSMSWSPDQELLVVVTMQLKAIFMTLEFDPIVELDLEKQSFGEAEFVNVGWGKKETQFHGSEGKASTKNVNKSVQPVFDHDDKVPRISWRGDGQLVAISYVSVVKNCRMLKVMSRDGVLQYTSEYIEGLEQSLNWRPSGNLIACSQRLPNKYNIIFFEKNGLQHGSFELQSNLESMKVIEVKWNTDSDVLLVWFQSKEESEKTQIIQLWTTGNYHWYLKDQLDFDVSISDLHWHPGKQLTLLIMMETNVLEYSWSWDVHASPCKSFADHAVVAVIDGRKVLVTPFGQGIVPPPMSAYEMVFPNQVHDIIFNQHSSTSGYQSALETSNFTDKICVYHGSNTLTFLGLAESSESHKSFDCLTNLTGFGGNGFKRNVSIYRAYCSLRLSIEGVTSFKCYNWVWVTNDILTCIVAGSVQSRLLIWKIVNNEKGNSSIELNHSILLENRVIFCSKVPNTQSILLQLETGLIKMWSVGCTGVSPWLFGNEQLRFPSPCQKVIVCNVEGNSTPLGLTDRHQLFMGNKRLLNSCTSFCLHTNHLLLTVTSHELLVVPLIHAAFKSLTTGIREEYIGVGIRNIERGARIVTAVGSDSKVIMQMPRGNLEAIYPRSLLLFSLKKLLDNCSYFEAIGIMRKNRLDMNLIFDHNPTIFVEHMGEFVDKVGNPHFIDLFISSLSSEDVTRTTYKQAYSGRERDIEVLLNKIDLVCDSIRKAMTEADEEKYLLPILSTYIKSTRKEIHLALHKLNELRTDSERKSDFEEGLRHLMYVADSNELCDVALGTYDFDLIMMVYEKSQKDPKEYLPFLNNLKYMEVNYRRFRIDSYLKRYESSFRNLKKCPNVENHLEECMNLIRKEKLYKEALIIFSELPIFCNSISEAFGDYLVSKGYSNEAGAMYFRANKLESSMKCYLDALNWRRCLALAAQMKLGREGFTRLCHELIKKLQEKDTKDSWGTAGFIFENYMGSSEDAVDCLVKANQFDEAFRVAYKFQRIDLVETHIKPSVLRHVQTINEEINRIDSEVKRHIDRLVEVRKEKLKEHSEFLEGNCDDHLDSDLYCDTSTIGDSSRSSRKTSSTGRSYRSSKNKRKMERKKYSTKEGSTYEDIGLVAALHQLYSSLPELTTQVSDLNSTLMFLGEDVKSQNLQDGLDSVMQECIKRKSTIWPNFDVLETDSGFGPDVTANNMVSRAKLSESQMDNNFLSSRMKELDPHLRFPPPIDNITNWKLFYLK